MVDFVASVYGAEVDRVELIFVASVYRALVGLLW